MGYIKQEDIVGYELDMGGGNIEVVCTDCVTKEELKDIQEENIIEDPQDCEQMCFCDRCKKQIY